MLREHGARIVLRRGAVDGTDEPKRQGHAASAGWAFKTAQLDLDDLRMVLTIVIWGPPQEAS